MIVGSVVANSSPAPILPKPPIAICSQISFAATRLQLSSSSPISSNLSLTFIVAQVWNVAVNQNEIGLVGKT
ncbi:unnamed protein product [Lactuca virosa]|uniref:Uncharacterized protein n=1 Tax=Lactuca virosa TaxID=75947 RepID=A0AAU9P0M2_9ASTR|nr:unnamed protein product [Lactuca virosa]